MNKTELKNFAVSARRDLLEKVALRAKIFGIDEKNGLTIEEKFGQLAINGETYPIDKKSAFLSLKKQLEIKGYEQLIEEVAYTWFNRIIAIRYMEVNEYLPERVNVLTSSTGKVEPDIFSEFETMDLDIDTLKIKDLIRQGETDDAYRKLFIAQCNALNEILPFMFEKIHDYTELLLPDFLLDSESVINKLVSNDSLSESFKEVEVIGWLYQFYNSEPKDKVFANLKKNKKIEKYDIPAATQLFTPKWIVQYMVENSLGQLWLESNPDSLLKETMRYYIEPAEQDEKVKQKLEQIRYKNVNLEEITILDPCVGSGHILVYAFDLLYQMYEEAGYPSAEIPQLILEKNLYGLDIDERATQLASFALTMKAREKSRRIFRKSIELNILSIHESNHIDKVGIAFLLGKNEDEKKDLISLIEGFIEAKNFGSILEPPLLDYEKYISRIDELSFEQLTTENYLAFEQMPEVKYLLKQANILASKYDVAMTNPPYMGSRGMGSKLLSYVKKRFNNSKYDMFSVFMERCYSFAQENRFVALITQPSWVQLSYYKHLRKFLLDNTIIQSLLYMGRGNFGIDFGSVAFVIRKSKGINYKGTYFKLYKRLFQYFDTNEIRELFLYSKDNEKNKHFSNLDLMKVAQSSNLKYLFNQFDFKKLPNYPFSFWISDKIIDIFLNFKPLKDIAEPRAGLQTGENETFVRYWSEVDYTKMGIGCGNRDEAKSSQKKWFPYNKGGDYRKWFGNNEYVVNWYNDGEDIRNDKLYKLSIGKCLESNSKPKNVQYYFRESITWSFVSSGNFGVRYSPKGAIFDIGGSSVFPNENLLLLIAFLNSKLSFEFLKVQNDTLNFQVGNIALLPIIDSIPEVEQKKINELAQTNISIATKDWNSFETSWDFQLHPFLNYRHESKLLINVFNKWMENMESQFEQLKTNEEEINRIFIELYELQDELSPTVSGDNITIRKANQEFDSKSFLSYFIGCVMGRYSLDVEGLAYAGGEWDDSKYKTFKPNKFGLIQITDEHYFENDIIARLRKFLSITFGEETIEENMQWLAESLELKRNEIAEERLRRYFLDEFFKDHCQVYQKRPIYWLVDSGKQKGLRTLIYMHRYQPDTMATIRFEHLQEIQAKYNNEIAAIDLRIVNPNLSATEKRDLEKRKTAFQKRLEELLVFDKKLAEYANAQIEIDLDDGVKVNYEKFDKVLAKIK
ncbi:BREX-1 system adenine-specific DNA-methyltransferase PglX [Robertmurraya andreesenii]|uniref:site-specific DNA-methyltransferase (adenine-specific) n=1 Tax=Anoxybacillus andreesenii TaxID=1325932 RepID=A0ABT9V6F4_9BACL|nr:BREX-1 system adenine-specific DNA-methyltransferase PglX [Robertmurraya andreesenii]MDQ0156522.1 type II restriction/modification system DNA methylase subunit YeeA [Robertmurraya andreesenii]